MKQHLSKVLILAFLFLLAPCLSAQAPSGVVKAARQGLTDFCQDMSDSGSLRLGLGFQVHTVNARALVTNRELTLQGFVFPMDMWRFIVLDNESPVGLLTVVKVDRQWEAVSFGGAELAKEIEAVETNWGRYSFRFIRVYQATSDFMEIMSGNDSLGFAPLKSARISLGIDNFQSGPGMLLYNSEILEPLREMVSRKLHTRQEVNKEK